MKSRLGIISFGAAVVMAACFATGLRAQVLVFGRGRPVGPAAGLRIGPARLPAGVYLGGRPLVVVGPTGIGGHAGYSEADYRRALRSRIASRQVAPPEVAATRDGTRIAEPFPTAGQVRAMGDAALLNTLSALAVELHADLARFTTAETWQRYLRLPDDALPAPTGNRVARGLASLSATRERFDLVVANPDYVQISGLPSFAAMQAALNEATRRFDRSRGVEDAPSTADDRRPFSAQLPAKPRPSPSDDALSGLTLERPHLTAETSANSSAEAPVSTAEHSPPTTEELPAPTPALVAPQNGERSVLAR